ncbi:MAG: multiheme c-type cytochrome [bacterium]
MVFTESAFSVKKEEFPFFPSLIQTSSGGLVPLKFFTSARKCGECHTRQYRQWNGSMHSQSFKDPVWQAFMKIYANQHGGKLNPQCVGCHTPIGLVTGKIKSYRDIENATGIVTDGVQCDVCHAIKKSIFMRSGEEPPRNTSFVLAPGNVKLGPYKNSDSDFHLTAFSSLHTQATICGNCHDLFHEDSNFAISRTYDEWKHSIYAASRIVCQDCHMIPVSDILEVALTLKKKRYPGTSAEGGPQRNHTYNHQFIGANFTLTEKLGSPEHAKLSIQRLKIAARIEIEAPKVLFGEELCRIKVKVKNQAAGHYLPTGLSEFREMWIFLEVRDRNGQEIFSSGHLDSKENIDPEATVFNTVTTDRQGHRTFLPWRMATIKSDNRIPPKGTSSSKYQFLVNENTPGPLAIHVELRYRSFPQSLINMLFKEKTFKVKYTVMATADQKIRLFKK